MGLFQQKADDEENQWVLPSEPFERAEAEVLTTAPTVDPLSVGIGTETEGLSSILFPVAPPPPAARETYESAEPASGES